VGEERLVLDVFFPLVGVRLALERLVAILAAPAGKEADGYVLANVALAGNATVYFGGINTSVSALTIGTTYFLSTTPGGSTATAPSATGNVVQRLGKALSATEMETDTDDVGIVVA
jgi:hypothetical protein